MAGYKLATYQSSDGPRAGLVIDDKVFDAAKLTGKAAYATMLGILEDWRGAQGALRKAAANAGKGRVKGLPLGRTKLAHEPADGAGSPHSGSQGMAFPQGIASARRSGCNREDFRRLQ